MAIPAGIYEPLAEGSTVQMVERIINRMPKGTSKGPVRGYPDAARSAARASVSAPHNPE